MKEELGSPMSPLFADDTVPQPQPDMGTKTDGSRIEPVVVPPKKD